MTLIEYIMNLDSLSGTKIEQYINLAVSETSPQIYKPRQGKVNGNMNKFNEEQLGYIYNYAQELIDKLDYTHIFTNGQRSPLQDSFMLEYNEKNHI